MTSPSQPIVRSRLVPDPAPRFGRFYERTAGRTPRFMRRLGWRALQRVPPGSHFRTALIGQVLTSNLRLWARADKAALSAYDADARMMPPQWAVDIGFEPVYVGHDGLRRFMLLWAETWSSISFVPTELIDAGDVVVVAVHTTATGTTSGAETSRDVFYTITTKHGVAVEHVFSESLEAAMDVAGIDPEAVVAGTPRSRAA